jgi:haloalkane dehalogenase
MSSLGAAGRPEWVAERLFPFESRFPELDEARVHYIDEGSGPTLLLLHGNPTWAFLYRNIVKGLTDRFRCIALDYPGFGLSTAPAGYDFTPAAHTEVGTVRLDPGPPRYHPDGRGLGRPDRSGRYGASP